MLRLRFPLILFVLVLIALGCSRKPTADPINGNLKLKLPNTEKAPSYDSARVIGKLTIDGRDYSEPHGNERTLNVQSKAGTDEITIVYSYWPTTYENVIRTRVVKLVKDQTVTVDMTSFDRAQPDAVVPIYVPTPKKVVTEMCRLGKIGPDDVVYDIGCGQGLLLLQAVKEFNAKKGVGIEIDTGLYGKCLEHRKEQKLDDKVEFRNADALKIDDYSEATVVLLYVGNELGRALKPVLQRTLKPGTRIVSHRFLLEDWQPDESKTINAPDDSGVATNYDLHIWRVKK